MMLCRTLDEVLAAAEQDALGEPIRDQAWADRIALILAPRLAREPATA